MPDYRRWYVPGGTYFFTVVSYRRAPFLCCDAARPFLHAAIDRERQDRPFEIRAIVLLPDHLHTLWTLPPHDADYSTRWSAIKAEFTRNWLALGGGEGDVSVAERREGRRGVWQPRFREHTIRDEDDFENHFDYIHYNPVKHGHARAPKDWPWSTFHKYVRLGIYPANWASGKITIRNVNDDSLE